MKNHPNAKVAGGGGAVGVLVAYLLGKTGVQLEPEAAAAISTGIAAAALFIGRNGLRGAIQLVWRGKRSAR